MTPSRAVHVFFILIITSLKGQTHSRMIFKLFPTVSLLIFVGGACGMHLWKGVFDPEHFDMESCLSEQPSNHCPTLGGASSQSEGRIVNDPSSHFLIRLSGIKGNEDLAGIVSHKTPNIQEPDLNLRLGQSHSFPHVGNTNTQTESNNQGCEVLQFFRQHKNSKDETEIFRQTKGIKRLSSQDVEDPHVDFGLKLALGSPKIRSSKRFKNIQKTRDVFESTMTAVQPDTRVQQVESNPAPLPLEKHVYHNCGVINHGAIKHHSLNEASNSQSNMDSSRTIQSGIRSTGELMLEETSSHRYHDTLTYLPHNPVVEWDHHIDFEIELEKKSALLKSSVLVDGNSLSQPTTKPHLKSRKPYHKKPLISKTVRCEAAKGQRISGDTNPVFDVVVYDPSSRRSEVAVLRNNSLEQFAGQGQRLTISYHLFVLSWHRGMEIGALARKHIDFQQGKYTKCSWTDMTEPISNIDPISVHPKTKENIIDWHIKRMISQQTEHLVHSSMQGRSKKPLSFLQSVGYVKVDLLPELKAKIDSWFLEFRDEMFLKIGDLVDLEMLADIISKIHHALAKAHGLMVFGIMGTFVMMNKEAKHVHDEVEILNKCWNSIKEQLYEWRCLDTVDIRDLCNHTQKLYYIPGMEMKPKILLKILFQMQPITSLSTGFVWAMVIQCLRSRTLQSMICRPPAGYFETKLLIIENNMKALGISGVSQGVISQHLFDSTSTK